MAIKALERVGYENYLQLLKSLEAAVVDLFVFDREATLIWSSAVSGQPVSSMIRERIQAGNTASNTINYQSLPDGQGLLLLALSDEADQKLVTLAIVLTELPTTEESARRLSNGVVHGVSACMQREIGLNLLLDEQDNELGKMVDELAVRYEELNLVYEADDQIDNAYQGQEALRQLVRNCISFLNVGMTVLLLPGMELILYEVNRAEQEFKPVKILPVIKHLSKSIEKDAQAIVINHDKELTPYRLGCEFPYKFIACPVSTGEAGVIGTLAILQQRYRADFTNSDRNLLDVMAKKVAKIVQNSYDSLTGLENHHSFEWRVEQALQHAWDHGRSHAILNVNIDRTRVINDISGREAGDKLIQTIGRMLTRVVRSADVVARLEGDKFAVLLENCPLETANKIAQQIINDVRMLEFEWQDEIHEASVSIGVVPVNAECKSISNILSAAELAQSVAKERGRNRLQLFQQGDIDMVRRKEELQWVGRIQAALRENRFVLYAQEIRPLAQRSGEIHYEVLLRMIGHAEEVVAPGLFLPAAEHYHLMPAIDRWVVMHLVDQLLASVESHAHHPGDVALNLSGQSLCDDEFQSFLFTQLERLGSLSKHLCFEVTESAAVANLKEASRFIDRIKALGSRVSLDDFGTGLSSFAYLKNLDVDYLKIDGSFVKQVDNDPISETLVTAINEVGHAMGLQTIAEYVENESIQRRLVELGVDYGQGYGLSRPMPLQEYLDALLLQRQMAAV